jgi:hypothetical protein
MFFGTKSSPHGEQQMRDSRHLRAILLAVVFSSAVLGMGCGDHHHYRVYDSYHTDYHVWNSGEVVYYQQWSVETHRDSHRDFRRLPPEQQKEYWDWRHNHDRDHDHH